MGIIRFIVTFLMCGGLFVLGMMFAGVNIIRKAYESGNWGVVLGLVGLFLFSVLVNKLYEKLKEFISDKIDDWKFDRECRKEYRKACRRNRRMR